MKASMAATFCVAMEVSDARQGEQEGSDWAHGLPGGPVDVLFWQ